MIRPTLARVAALDTRVETYIRDNPECSLGDIASNALVAQLGGYQQVIGSTRRLIAAGRITSSGVSRARRYAIAADLARMTSVTQREPKLGDRVWARWFDKLIYGEFVSYKEFVGGRKVYEVKPFNSATVEVERIALDGCKLIREIESEESK